MRLQFKGGYKLRAATNSDFTVSEKRIFSWKREFSLEKISPEQILFFLRFFSFPLSFCKVSLKMFLMKPSLRVIKQKKSLSFQKSMMCLRYAFRWRHNYHFNSFCSPIGNNFLCPNIFLSVNPESFDISFCEKSFGFRKVGQKSTTLHFGCSQLYFEKSDSTSTSLLLISVNIFSKS